MSSTDNMSAFQTVSDFFSSMAKKAGIMKDTNKPESKVSNMEQSKQPVGPREVVEVVERPKREAVNVFCLFCLI